LSRKSEETHCYLIVRIPEKKYGLICTYDILKLIEYSFVYKADVRKKRKTFKGDNNVDPLGL